MNFKNKKIYLCNSSEIEKSKYVIKWINQINDEIIVYKYQNLIYVRSSICSHFGGEIFYDEGSKNLRCKWHDWKFCPKTGKCLTHKILGKLNAYDFELKPNNLKNYQYKINKKNIYLIL